MKYCHFFAVLLLALATGCATPAAQDVAASSARPAMALSDLVMPLTLNNLELLAQSQSQEQRHVVYRSSLETLPSLQISIYPLPDGWELWDTERQLLGHYGQIRLEVLNQLAVRGDNFSLVKEEHEPDFNLDIPVAKLQARTATGATVLIENHLLALHQGYYFKARYDAEENDSPLALENGEILLRHFIQQLFPGS